MSGISFNHIPINLLTPGVYVEFDNSKAITGLVGMPQRILMFVPKLETGTAPDNRPLQISSAAAGMAACGRGSIGAAMISASYGVTDTVETWIVPVPDGGAGQAAHGKIAFAGAPEEAGTLNLYIGGRRVQVGISLTDTADVIAEEIADAINADADGYVTAAANGAEVTVTCRHQGALGNDIDLRVNYYGMDEFTPKGLAITFTAMAGGTGDASIATALANIGERQYNTVITACNDSANLVLMKMELDKRWGPLFQNDGHCHLGYRGSVGSLNTWLSNHNNPHFNVWTSETGGEPQPVWEKASRAGTVSSYYLGIDPARPLQTLILTGHMPAPDEVRFARPERNQILSYGGSTTVVDDDGNVCIERAVTSYKTNSYGLVDPSYRDIETMYTLSLMRYQVRARITQLYPRHKLAGDGDEYPPGQAIVQPKTMKASIIALAMDWRDAGLLEDLDGFKRDLIVARNTDDPNTMDILLPPNLVNQLRVTRALMQFRL